MEKLSVSSFELSSVAHLINGYEIGQGYMNIPDQTVHTCMKIYDDYTTYIPDTLPEKPYCGYGWYLRQLKDITVHEKIDLDHLMQTMELEDFKNENIYVVFSKRLSQVVRPCLPPEPLYIGYCKKCS
jgi:hypothetical protein